MRLMDILQPDCVKVPLAAGDKRGAIFELADLLAGRTPIADADALKQAVWNRETTRTTGIGHGIAIPHGKTRGVDRLRLAVGRTAAPLEFGAIDRKPVELIFLLASPADQTGPHIQALGRLSRMLIDEDFRQSLKEAPTGEAMFALIEGAEAEA